MATTSFTSMRSEADCVGASGGTPLCAMLDTPSHSLYTRAYVPLRTVPVQTAS
jgi:hypothetical protein